MTILDTDVFTHLTFGQANTCRHYEAVPESEPLAVTSITRTEVLRGRMDSLLTAGDEAQLMVATRRLLATEEVLADFLVLHIDETAARHFTTLKGQKKLNRMKRPDMLIACIALAQQALLVTRNTKDFNKVAGLRLANWVDD